MANPKRARRGLEPAHSIIEACSGISVVAEICGVNRTTVWRWTKPKNKEGGTGGLIPAQYQPVILAWAIKNGKPVSASMFVVLKVAA